MHYALFIVGPPGVGKTSAIRELVGEGFSTIHPEDNKAVKFTVTEDICFAGHYGTGTFDGSDTVPMHGASICIDWWKENILPNKKYKATIFDGDRFSTSPCKASLDELEGVKALCVYMGASQETLDARREERGSNQDQTWLKGRESKCRNFADKFKPSDNSLLDMFGGDAEEEEDRCIEMTIENITPAEVAQKIKDIWEVVCK